MKKIIIIDDIIEQAKIIKNYIETLYKNEVKIYLACDLKKAFKIIKENNIDIIITDLELNNMNALKFIQKIKKEISNRLPIIVITGDTTNYSKCINLKVSSIIKKPFQIEDLKLELENIV